LGNRYNFTFIIHALPPTTNALNYRHWSVKRRHAVKWKRLVTLAVLSNRPTVPLQKARLKLTRFSSGRCDSDGLVSCFKHVIDGLVASGVLKDDSFKHIGMPTYEHKSAPQKKGYIQVEITEVFESEHI